jgi:hypothetical protein
MSDLLIISTPPYTEIKLAATENAVIGPWPRICRPLRGGPAAMLYSWYCSIGYIVVIKKYC